MYCEDGSAYVGQHLHHKMKEPYKDGYRGSGSKWKKEVLYKNLQVSKQVVSTYLNVTEANELEIYLINVLRELGVKLWNIQDGGRRCEKQRSIEWDDPNSVRLYNRQRYRKHHLKKPKVTREERLTYLKKHASRKCKYNGKVLTINALAAYLRRHGVESPYSEAKKYLI